mgnify:CR=1 FL=1
MKYAAIADRRHWYIPVEAVLGDADADQLLRLVDQAVQAKRQDSAFTAPWLIRGRRHRHNVASRQKSRRLFGVRFSSM